MKRFTVTVVPAGFRRGLTIVEILVVVGLIAVLLAMLIPAVQQTRRTASALACLNQLRQISLAALNYESSWSVMPSRRWAEQIASSLEYAPTDVHGQKRIRQLGCPMDHHDAIGNVDHMSYMLNTELTNDHPLIYDIQLDPPWRPLSHVTDGLSHTAMFGEVLSYLREAPRKVDWNARRNDWKRTFLFIPGGVEPGLDAFHRRCRSPGLSPSSGWWHCTTYRHVMQPNQHSCVGIPLPPPNSDPSLPVIDGARTAGSVHPGGAHIAFCDGSARFFTNEVDLKIWWALGTRATGEVISEF
jgi:prepilin-type processing-associated H-X9-DG protein